MSQRNTELHRIATAAGIVAYSSIEVRKINNVDTDVDVFYRMDSMGNAVEWDPLEKDDSINELVDIFKINVSALTSGVVAGLQKEINGKTYSMEEMIPYAMSGINLVSDEYMQQYKASVRRRAIYAVILQYINNIVSVSSVNGDAP